MADTFVATNRKALHEYFITETVETGIQLKGTEVKSLRSGQVSFVDSFARVENGEMILYSLHIAPYRFGTYANVDPVRPRKLLLHKREIGKFAGEVSQKGMTLIPLKIYFKRGIVKVELALAKGKRAYDKREAIKRRDSDKELRRALERH